MKSIVEQLSTYKSVHLNGDNIKTHFIGIPLIIWSVALLLNLVSFDFSLMGAEVSVNLMVVIGVLVCLYYAVLYIPLALMVLVIFGPIIYSTQWFITFDYPIALAGSVFAIGWILQFIGHNFEKAKPAFVDDLNQLSIGPLFLIAEIYFALGLNKTMEEEVLSKAIVKRKAFEQAKASA